MPYTRLLHQWFKTRPWSGLKQLPHWWRSVRHTHRNAKISSNVLICLFCQQFSPHWHSHSPLVSADFRLCVYDRSVKFIKIAGTLEIPDALPGHDLRQLSAYVLPGRGRCPWRKDWTIGRRRHVRRYGFLRHRIRRR